MMRAAAATAAAVFVLLLALAAPASAVDCGVLGDVPLSGCLVCSPVNITKPAWGGDKKAAGAAGAATNKAAGGPRNLLAEIAKPQQAKFPPPPPGAKSGDGGGWGKGGGSFLLPNCSVCDEAANFTLHTWGGGGGFGWHGGSKGAHGGRNLLGVYGWGGGWGGGNKTHNKTRPGRCVCKKGFGVVITGNATVSPPGKNKTWTVPLFRCEECTGNTVPLTHLSGLTVLPDGSVVLGGGGGGGAFSKSATVIGNRPPLPPGGFDPNRPLHPSPGNGGPGPKSAVSGGGGVGGIRRPLGDRPPPPGAARFDGPPGGGGKKGPLHPMLLPGGVVPGACIACPAGSSPTVNHVTCVADGA